MELNVKRHDLCFSGSKRYLVVFFLLFNKNVYNYLSINDILTWFPLYISTPNHDDGHGPTKA